MLTTTVAVNSAVVRLVAAVLSFGLGIGWNISSVAAAAQLADLSAPAERGRLLRLGGF